jgi:SAM-dependent methyltransferase
MESSADALSESNFEFDALRWARNYRIALIAEFGAYLRGRVVEVGAGIGQMTELVVRAPGVTEVLAVEPDPRFGEEFRRRLPGTPLIQGTVSQVESGRPCDCIVSVNVLEHIEADEAELRSYARLLKAARGVLCLFVPARPEIYAPIDKDFGHHRRYTRPVLHARLKAAGFEILRLNYFNLIGYFAWGLNFRLLRKRSFDERAVRFFDGAIFPVGHFLESRLIRPPIGQSLLAVGRAVS